MAEEHTYEESAEWMARAKRVIPGGIQGHQSPGLLTRREYPFFMHSGDGCRLRDVDGNVYIDFLCGYGPTVLGHCHPAVEKAVDTQRRLGDTMTLPSVRSVELAERLVGMTPGADWALFAKNGSDVCTWALAIARQATGRELVLMADHAYHGVHGWCNHLTNGFPDSDRAGVRSVAWNDTAALEAAFSADGERMAALILTPFRHEAFEDSVLPAHGYLEKARALCDRYGVLLVSDDVRTGFRLDMGGSMQQWGVTPDLLCYSKAIANGYPLAALLGTDALRDAAQSVFVTGTFFLGAVSMAAALATLTELGATSAIDHMHAMGLLLCDGLAERADAAGFEVVLSGPPSIPYMSFVADGRGFDRNRVFCGHAARSGVLFHPHHNWFLSAAHEEADIHAALQVAEESFAAVKAAF
jgi:glutamate-1-semialdehyde 2,1-aminomutase